MPAESGLGLGECRVVRDAESSRRVGRALPDQGWWTADTLGQQLAEGLEDNSHLLFRVHSTQRPFTGTFGEVELLARRLAAGLRARGVGPGDVVAFQLPNWMEAAATFWAASFLGAVVVPIVHFYGPKELRFILANAKPRVFITAERFGRMTYHPEVCADVPIVALVGGTFDALVDIEPMSGTLAADPAGPALIAFTSGTTSDPKGVIHSHQTLAFETRQLLANYPPGRGRQLTALPVGHFIGMLSAFLIPVVDGAPIDLCDVWDPERAITLMESDGVSFGGGPPYFVTSLLDHPRFTDDSPLLSEAHRSRRIHRAIRRHPPPRPISGSSSPAPTAARNIPRSPARTSPHRRTSGYSPTAVPDQGSRSG